MRKVFTNVNIITLLIGFVFMFTGFRLPGLVDSAVRSVGSMLGPISMLIVGMTLAGLDLSSLRDHPRLWMVIAAKMVVFPPDTDSII